MRRWWIAPALVALAWRPAGADDAQALDRLVAGDEAAKQKRLDFAWREWNLAYGLASSNYLSIEALGRLAGTSPLGSRERASAVGRLLAYFGATPPRWVSDDGRKILTTALGEQIAAGAAPALVRNLGVRSSDFAAVRTGLDFQGKRHSWVISLPAIPPPADVQRLDGEFIQRDDQDRLPDLRMELGEGRWSVVETRHSAKEVPVESKMKWRFDRCLLGYSFEPLITWRNEYGRDVQSPIRPWYNDQQAIWQLRFRLFYPSSVLGGYGLEPVAEDLLDTLLRLHWLASEGLGRKPWDPQLNDQVIDVWLTPQAAEEALHAGGERWLNNLYFYHAAAPREAFEWVREAAHEYGHAVMPRIGRFTATQQYEPWLDGPLGERLLLRSLAEQVRATPEAELNGWLQHLKQHDFTPAWRAADWDPLVAGFLAKGPQAAESGGVDDQAAAWLLGFALWMADTATPRFVHDFYRALTPNAQYTAEALLKSYTARLKEQKSFVLDARIYHQASDTPAKAVEGGVELAEHITVDYLAWLDADRWDLRVLSAASGAVTVEQNGGADRLLETGPDPRTAPKMTIDSPGAWFRLRVGGFGSQTTTVTSLVFQRSRRGG